MSKPLNFYRDRSEKFRATLHIDGASLDKSTVRLCLQIKEGLSYFFTGKIDSSGLCTIPIPALPNITSDEGIATVEVIAESSYFKVYETPVIIKNSVTVKFVPEVDDEEELEENVKPKITFDLVQDEEEIEESLNISIGDYLEIPSKNGKVQIKVINVDSDMVKGDWINASKDSDTKLFSIKTKELMKLNYKKIDKIKPKIDVTNEPKIKKSLKEDLNIDTKLEKVLNETTEFTTFNDFMEKVQHG